MQPRCDKNFNNRKAGKALTSFFISGLKWGNQDRPGFDALFGAALLSNAERMRQAAPPMIAMSATLNAGQ